MGKFRIEVDKKARKDFKKIYSSGNRSAIRKVELIIQELSVHPTTGTGNPEQLKHQLAGYWSRRINKKDRLVYEIIDNGDKKVIIISALGHYL